MLSLKVTTHGQCLFPTTVFRTTLAAERPSRRSTPTERRRDPSPYLPPCAGLDKIANYESLHGSEKMIPLQPPQVRKQRNRYGKRKGQGKREGERGREGNREIERRESERQREKHREGK